MATAEAHTHEHHIVPTSTYVKTLLALFVLMVLTVAAAGVNLPEIGPFSGTVVNQVVALTIAVIKAYLVVTIFMGVKYGTKLVKLWAILGFVWVSLIWSTLGDYTTRKYELAPSWDGRNESALPRQTPKEHEIPDRNHTNVMIRQ